MSLEVTVLGSAGTHPAPGRACSGYLLRSATTHIMVDCGNGSSGNLQRHVAIEDLDALVITHRHPDHCVDLIAMYFALRFHPAGPHHLDVYAPAGTDDFLAALVPESEGTFRELCRFHEVAPGDHLEVGPVRLRLYNSVHSVPTVAIRAEADGAVVTYSADSAGGRTLVEAAAAADLFICEATWLGRPSDWPDGVHLTATGAAEVAQAAGVGGLLLTHLWPRNDPAVARAQAQAAYQGPLELAQDGAVLHVGSGR